MGKGNWEQYGADSDELARLADIYLGKKLIVTNDKKRTTEELIVASHSQYVIEHIFKEMKKRIITAIVLAPILLTCYAAPVQKVRPAKWAQPIELKGVPNLHKVSRVLYRSAQPSKTGMKNLKDLGIKTIVNLRSFHSDRDKIGTTDLEYEHIYMKSWHPEEEDVIRFLKIVTNEKRTPVLVHCHYGADRTGTMCAIYRIAVEGWTKKEAISEMKKGGYGFHKIWVNLVRWINGLDMDSIRKKAGIKNPQTIKFNATQKTTH